MDEIEQLRKKIDEIDDKIISSLCERAKVCREIGEAKKKYGIPIRNLARENEVYQRIKEKAVLLGLDSDEIQAVYREIVNMCSSVQV
ncbi:MAG: chorismate mutase [Candidatus Bathyarchaeota archaeon]|nr:chorismate mutase [Candidatus Bathyarchaeota archaeon]MDD4324916.1 chorismate mutase [Candidatus Bathyarchaeota archaeon]MDI9577461.1 chorismate mutase [Thermoproteota archaeon]NLD65003.1 chorismate mutase [Thermoproteota archaeon]